MKSKKGAKRIKSLMVILLLLCGLFFVPAKVCADSSQDKQVIRVGYYEMPGFNECSEQNNYSGYGYEYLMELQKYTNWEYKFVTTSEGTGEPLTYEEALNMLKQGKLDIVGGVQKDETNMDDVFYPEYSCGINYGILTTRTGNTLYLEEEPQSMNGMCIGLLAGSSRNQEIKDYIQEKGIKYCTYKEFPDMDSLRIALNDNNEVDAIYSSNLRKTEGERTILSISPKEFFFVTTKTNVSVMQNLSYGMEQIWVNNGQLNTELLDKYYKSSGISQVVLTQKERAYINQKKKIKVGIDPGFTPIEFCNEKTGKADGISVKILKLIEKKTGIQFEYTIPKKYENVLQDVKNHNVDLLPSFAADYDWAKKSNVKITSPYITLAISSISRVGADLNDDTKRVVVMDCFYLSEQIKKNISYGSLVHCSNLAEGVRMVDEGKADVIYMPTYCVDTILNNETFPHVKTTSCISLSYQLAFAVNEDCDTELYSIMNKSINSLSSSEINACALENLLVDTHKSNLRQLIVRNPIVSVLTVTVFFVILGLVSYWIICMRRKTKKQLELNNQRLQLALSKSNVLVWDFNLETQLLELVEQMEDGLHRRKIENVPESLVNERIVHGKTAAACIRLYENVKKGEVDNTEELYIKDTTGKYEWYRVSFIPVEFRHNEVITAIGVGECIQQQKVAEELYQDARIYYRREKESVVANFKYDLSKNQLLGWEDHGYAQYRKGEPLEETVLNFLPYIVQPERKKEVKGLFRAQRLLAKFRAGTQVLSKEFQYRYNDSNSWICVNVQMIKEQVGTGVLAFITFQNIGKQRLDTLNREMIRRSMQTAIDENYIFGAAINIKDGKYQFLKSNFLGRISVEGKLEDLTQESIQMDWSMLDYLIHPEKIVKDINGKEQIELIEQIKVPGSDQVIWSEQTIRPIHIDTEEPEDNIIFLLLIRDIEEQKQSEEELRKALEVAKQAVEAKQKFLSNMSHELRTPLNGIKGILEIMKQDPSQNTPKHLDDVIISANHLSGLINDILDMSKIDSGKMTLQNDVIIEDSVSKYVERLMKPLAEEKNITFTVQKKNNLVNGIIGDEKRIRQILTNLLSNAIKYTDVGGAVSYQRVVSQLDESTIMLTYTIADNGIGMSEEFLNKAMSPFEQESRVKNVEGTGLGLLITKQLVELMNGTIEIDSKINEGTRITVKLTFPVFFNSAKEIQDSQSDLQKKTFVGKKVLIVEDNELNQEIAKIQVESFGLLYECAVNGQEAVDKFAVSPEGYYDLILMDVMMPVLDGMEATRQIRALPRNDAKKVQIVAMTANAFAEDIHRTKESGMNYHLSKPFEREDMASIFNQCL